jgi:xeroderma pigmentosum group C-complementing protein
MRNFANGCQQENTDMPPFLPRKRLDITPPDSPRTGPPPKRTKLIDTLDTDPRPSSSLQTIRDFSIGGDDSDSSLSDVDSNDFEDVAAELNEPSSHAQQHDDDEDEDKDIDWEDAIVGNTPRKERAPLPSGDLQLTFSKSNLEPEYRLAAGASGARKGPSRREREVRMITHRLHVQFLLYHNAIRNNWICDKSVQDVLVNQLPTGVKKEVEKWRAASGFDVQPETAQATLQSSRGKKRGKQKVADERNQRDWGAPSQRLEKGKPDLSRADPIIPLMKVLAAYWKKRFRITAPGLRKRGYGTKVALQQVIASYRHDQHDPEIHGERIRNLEEFREAARECKGSRDLGAQLFTALLRGLGVESRMVASLQPSGFGFTKAEQAGLRNAVGAAKEESLHGDSEDEPKKTPKTQAKIQRTPSAQAKHSANLRGDQNTPIDLDASSADENMSDDEPIIDITPAMPAQKPAQFDRDLPFPIYWTEAVSPISHKVFPVSPLVLENPVATTPEMVAMFEPRGAKADKAKQVIAYVVAYSADGTAKDVTTRYLKRRMWPGKTKGFRAPVEKIAVRNAHGKVKRYEEYDWFKTAMSGYVRTDKMRTAVDDVEESSDLVPWQPEKKENQDEGDTLQSLKTSADWVLERFLRREEALRPDAKPDRMFVSGKGDKLTQEPVYRRADVERCLTAESWHKDGRRPKAGVVPLKQVPIRAMTLTRKREVEEVQRQTGEIPTQGLYSRDQTEYIIPEPITGGIIPKNAYGNIDCFVPTMVPKGAVHVPMRGTVRICKKLEIDYAEAVTGFEFGRRMAVPVITGVVVAKENEKAVREAWKVWDEEQRKKEEGKLEKAVLALWRKFLMGLRINERVQEAYGDETDGDAHLGAGEMENKSDVSNMDEDSNMGGGFLLPHENEDHADELIMEHIEPHIPMKQPEATQYPTPTSMPSSKQKGTRKLVLAESSDSSELSELSSCSDDIDSLTADSEGPEESITPKSRTRTRPTHSRKDVLVKAPATQRRALPKRGMKAMTSQYFQREDEESDV